MLFIQEAFWSRESTVIFITGSSSFNVDPFLANTPIPYKTAQSAGLGDLVEPAVLVADSIIQALEKNQFHAYPGSIAKEVGAAYAGFATNVVEAA